MSSSASSSSEEDVEVAVLSRSRRSTAGSRMTSLVGKARDDDEAFWGHSTWSEGPTQRKMKSDNSDADSDSSQAFHSDDDGSYKESDEDEKDRVDKFDSDFDDSESDDGLGDGDNDNDQANKAEEELRREERAEKSKKGKARAYREPKLKAAATAAMDIQSAGRRLMKRKKGKGRVGEGDGVNAGLVLNFPNLASNKPVRTSPSIPQTLPPQFTPAKQSTTITNPPQNSSKITPTTRSQRSTQTSCINPVHPKSLPSTSSALSSQKQSKPSLEPTTSRPSSKSSAPTAPTPFVTRSLRAATVEKTMETTKSAREADKLTKQRRAAIRDREKKKPTKKRFQQEELIREAVEHTEPSNDRWILGRKRLRDGANAARDHSDRRTIRASGAGAAVASKVIMKFHSRRGALNTLTFPEMDAVPEILCRKRKLDASADGVDHVLQQPNTATANPNGTEPTNAVATRHGDTSVQKKYDTCLCPITGKPARYRDPKTKLGYYDISAFRELRRRHEAGEQLKNPKPRSLMAVGSDSADMTKFASMSQSNILVKSKEKSKEARAAARRVRAERRAISADAATKLPSPTTAKTLVAEPAAVNSSSQLHLDVKPNPPAILTKEITKATGAKATSSKAAIKSKRKGTSDNAKSDLSEELGTQVGSKSSDVSTTKMTTPKKPKNIKYESVVIAASKFLKCTDTATAKVTQDSIVKSEESSSQNEDVKPGATKKVPATSSSKAIMSLSRDHSTPVPALAATVTETPIAPSLPALTLPASWPPAGATVARNLKNGSSLSSMNMKQVDGRVGPSVKQKPNDTARGTRDAASTNIRVDVDSSSKLGPMERGVLTEPKPVDELWDNGLNSTEMTGKLSRIASSDSKTALGVDSTQQTFDLSHFNPQFSIPKRYAAQDIGQKSSENNGAAKQANKVPGGTKHQKAGGRVQDARSSFIPPSGNQGKKAKERRHHPASVTATSDSHGSSVPMDQPTNGNDINFQSIRETPILLGPQYAQVRQSQAALSLGKSGQPVAKDASRPSSGAPSKRSPNRNPAVPENRPSSAAASVPLRVNPASQPGSMRTNERDPQDFSGSFMPPPSAAHNQHEQTLTFPTSMNLNAVGSAGRGTSAPSAPIKFHSNVPDATGQQSYDYSHLPFPSYHPQRNDLHHSQRTDDSMQEISKLHQVRNGAPHFPRNAYSSQQEQQQRHQQERQLLMMRQQQLGNFAIPHGRSAEAAFVPPRNFSSSSNAVVQSTNPSTASSFARLSSANGTHVDMDQQPSSREPSALTAPSIPPPPLVFGSPGLPSRSGQSQSRSSYRPMSGGGVSSDSSVHAPEHSQLISSDAMLQRPHSYHPQRSAQTTYNQALTSSAMATIRPVPPDATSTDLGMAAMAMISPSPISATAMALSSSTMVNGSRLDGSAPMLVTSPASMVRNALSAYSALQQQEKARDDERN